MLAVAQQSGCQDTVILSEISSSGRDERENAARLRKTQDSTSVTQHMQELNPFLSKDLRRANELQNF